MALNSIKTAGTVIEILSQRNVKDVERGTGIPADRMYKWLKGKGNPKTEDLIKLITFLEIDLNNAEPGPELIPKIINESINNAKPLHEVQYPITPGESPFIDMGNGQYTMLVPLVDEYSYASFPGGFRDPEYIEELRKISITVEKQHSGTYFAFEILGESMENYTSKEDAKKSIPEGAVVVGREIQRHHWKSRLHYHRWASFIFVHKEYGIACKTVLDQAVEDGIIHLGSFNPDKKRYKDFTWHLDDIQAIYNVVRIINEP